MRYGFIRTNDNWCIVKEIHGILFVEQERINKPLYLHDIDDNNTSWIGYRLSFTYLGDQLLPYYNRLIEWFDNRQQILEKYFETIL